MIFSVRKEMESHYREMREQYAKPGEPVNGALETLNRLMCVAVVMQVAMNAYDKGKAFIQLNDEGLKYPRVAKKVV